MSVIRLPFRWERLQPVLGAPLDPEELARLDLAVSLAGLHGMSVVLDPHNYARYAGAPVGSAAVPVAAFADFWSRLARVYRNRPEVIFGLMNEPHDIAATDWLLAANAAIAAIRAAGAGNLVLVPGTAWTGAHSWEAERPGGSNAAVMAGVADPAGNFAYDVHQYLDADFSGTSPACPRAGDAVDALRRFTGWLKRTGSRGFLGEFSGSAAPDCLAGLAAMARFVGEHRDRWIGWSYWAAGDRWPPDDPFTLQPTAAGDRPQFAALEPYLACR